MAFQSYRLSSANAALELSQLKLSQTSTQLSMVTTVFSNYQADVKKDRDSFQALQDSITKISQGVSNVNQTVKNYKPTAVLDEPWPDDFIRLRGQPASSVPANSSSGKGKTPVRSTP